MLLCFILFIIICYRPFKNFLINTLDCKIKNIRSKIDQSISISNNAEEMLIEAKKKLIEAKHRKITTVTQAQKIANNITESRLNELEIRIKEYELHAHERIEYEKYKAKERIFSHFFDFSSNIALKYINNTLQNPTTNMITSMIDNKYKNQNANH
ncbi:hypothetical protein [Orientia tsutsugamushi]|nr:hypothetical protein [Orientia tsutsugamushi]KJV56497.1 ATP synthase B/B' CF family protein [Orientia tsutsugamushi str. Kato PP]SPM46325.1 ATP synthase subunit b [Orientia tsutsugamushi]SPR09743.1 ATP synthase subunit b [Orientia tsutsugamushi]